MPRLSYDDWIKAVDRHVQKVSPVSLDDLADAETADMYDAGMSPASAAHAALDADGFDED